MRKALRYAHGGSRHCGGLQELPETPSKTLPCSGAKSCFPDASGIDVDLHKSDWDTADTKHSQLWRIHYITADFTPSSTRLEQLEHSANPPWWTPLNPGRVDVNITLQKKEEVSGAHTSLINTLVNDPQHPLLYIDRSQT